VKQLDTSSSRSKPIGRTSISHITYQYLPYSWSHAKRDGTSATFTVSVIGWRLKRPLFSKLTQKRKRRRLPTSHPVSHYSEIQQSLSKRQGSIPGKKGLPEYRRRSQIASSTITNSSQRFLPRGHRRGGHCRHSFRRHCTLHPSSRTWTSPCHRSPPMY
jgi:hypothetical protein